METAKQSSRMTLGKFEVKKASRWEYHDLYIFDSIDFNAIDKCLKRKTDVRAQLLNDLLKYQGLKPNRDLIPIYNNPDINGNEVYDTYHIKDCTVNFFDDRDRGLAYLLIVNEDYKKRERVLSLLEEVFS